MCPSVTTRSVSRHLFRNYLKKADELHEAMGSCYDRKAWNATVINAIHCAISCADALTVFHLGFRHAGDKHNDVILLLHQIEIEPSVLKNKIKQLSSLLSIKNSAEYEERQMSEKDANSARKAADRFYFWTKNKLA